MSEFVYLMKNGDLYKLGCTSDLEIEASKMKQGEILKLLLAFVLGFMVCKVTKAGKLIEGNGCTGKGDKTAS